MDGEAPPERDPCDFDSLRDALALVFALRAGDEAAARRLISIRGSTDFALVEAFVGIVEALGIDTAARAHMTFDEMLRRVALALAALGDRPERNDDRSPWPPNVGQSA